MERLYTVNISWREIKTYSTRLVVQWINKGMDHPYLSFYPGGRVDETEPSDHYVQGCLVADSRHSIRSLRNNIEKSTGNELLASLERTVAKRRGCIKQNARFY